MCWQLEIFDRIAASLPDAEVRLQGSAGTPELLDGWSDLDLRLITDRPVPVAARSGYRGAPDR